MLEDDKSFAARSVELMPDTISDNKLEKDLVDIAYLNNRFGWIGVVILWLVYLYLFRNSSGLALVAWSVGVAVGVVAHLYIVHLHSIATDNSASLKKSTRAMLCSSAYQAEILGWSPIVFLDLHDLTSTYFIAALIAGPLFGSAVVLATMKKTHIVFTLVYAQPFTLLILFSGVKDFQILGLLFQLTGIPLSIVLNSYFYSMIRKSIRLKYDNMVLLEIVQKQKEVAEKENKSKTILLATASHDLRQPLCALNLYLEALASLEKSTQQCELINKSRNLSQSLGGLINTLIDTSRLDVGNIELRIETLSLNELLQDLVNEFQLVAKKKGMLMRLGNSNYRVESDLVLLTAIIRNLMSNAIVHNNSGDINIEVQDLEHTVVIKVIDHGKGFSESERKNIFREHYQLNNPGRNRNIGLGLGLSIVKRAADTLGYEIKVTSEEGIGSEFSFNVPKVINADATVEQTPHLQLQ